MKKSFVTYFAFFVSELIFLIAAVYSGISIKKEVDFQAAIDGGVIVDAKIVSKSSSGAKVSPLYDTNYKYIDENGVVYTGVAEINLSYDEACAKIGTTAPIYIGENGVSIRVGYEPSLAGAIILAIVFSLLFIGGNIVLMVMILRKRKKEKSKRLD